MRQTLAMVSFLAFLTLGTIGCFKSPDEREIRQVLESVRTAVEEMDFEAALQSVTNDYSDNLGQDREQIRIRFHRMFGRYAKLEIKLKINKLTINGMTADVLTKVIVFGLYGNERQRLFGFPLQADNFQIALQKRSGEWKITGSTVMRIRGR